MPEITYQTIPLERLITCGIIVCLFTAIESLGVIPPIHIINIELQKGESKYTSWEPFEINQQEYEELVDILISEDREYRIEDKTLWSYPDFASWKQALIDKIRQEPIYKPLSWGNQNEVIGIPIGAEKWIRRNYTDMVHKAKNVDHILNSLTNFLYHLHICDPDCCGIAAFDFYRENIIKQADQLGRLNIIRKLDLVLVDLDRLDPKFTTIKSEMMNCSLMKSELIELLEHIRRVISK